MKQLSSKLAAPYGYCPECGSPGVMTEKRPNGDTVCANRHKHPRSQFSQCQMAAAPGGVQMTATLRAGLTSVGVRPEIVNALAAAMLNSGVNPSAQTYANAMDRAWHEYQLDGVKHQVLYMLGNMTRWQGEEAKSAKALLKKWCSR